MLGAHAVAVPLVLALAWFDVARNALALATVEGALAALISRALRLPGWWVAIQLVFAPLALAVHTLQLDARWYLAAFVLLALVFGAIHASRVPLYLSSDAALERVIECIALERPIAFFDAGCGVGSALAAVSRVRPLALCTGVEAAPLPWLVAALRGASTRPGFSVRFGSLWRASLQDYEVVYAYLSPAAMPRFWDKARREMKSGALLISNSFPVAQTAPWKVVPWGDETGEALFLYRM